MLDQKKLREYRGGNEQIYGESREGTNLYKAGHLTNEEIVYLAYHALLVVQHV
jgi:hypothetical protein